MIESVPHSKPVNALQNSDYFKQVSLSAKLEGYDILGLLGVGGFGQVFLARDKRLNRKVALKFLSSNSPEKNTFHVNYSKLKKEAESASRLSHENIVQIFSWHTANDLVFYSMELVEGSSLDQLLQSQPDLPLSKRLQILADAASGLASAHRQNVLHCDIKPQNILVTRDGKVKISDFGLARAIQEIGDDSQSGRTVIAGTLGFMSPEVAKGSPPTVQSDLYSLAATAYYLLSGKTPFGASRDTSALLEANRTGTMVPLYEEQPDYPLPIYKLITKGLHNRPAMRYQSADEFRYDLERCFLQSESQQEKPFSWSSLTPKQYILVGFAFGLLTGIPLGWLIASWK